MRVWHVFVVIIAAVATLIACLAVVVVGLVLVMATSWTRGCSDVLIGYPYESPDQRYVAQVIGNECQHDVDPKVRLTDQEQSGSTIILRYPRPEPLVITLTWHGPRQLEVGLPEPSSQAEVDGTRKWTNWRDVTITHTLYDPRR